MVASRLSSIGLNDAYVTIFTTIPVAVMLCLPCNLRIDGRCMLRRSIAREIGNRIALYAEPFRTLESRNG